MKTAIFITGFCLVLLNQQIKATPFVSNLGNVWTQGGIGDIHALFPGGANYGSDTAYFTTGAGNFSANSITLEFEFDASYSAGLSSPQWVNIQLFQKVGNATVLLGSFGNPVVDAALTQWPQSSNPQAYTSFIDFSALGVINLNPYSQYSVVVSLPGNSPVDAALMFSKSSNYTSLDGWGMSATSSGNSAAGGEYLMMAVNATSVPDIFNSASLLAGGLIGVIGGCRIFKKKSVWLVS